MHAIRLFYVYHNVILSKFIAKLILRYLVESLDIANYKHNIEDFHLQFQILNFLKIPYYPLNPTH